MQYIRQGAPGRASLVYKANRVWELGHSCSQIKNRYAHSVPEWQQSNTACLYD